MAAKIIDIVKFLPDKVVKNNIELQKIDSTSTENFFKGVDQRHFASPKYSSIDLGTTVMKKLLHKNNINANEVDLIICSCVFTDTFWPGVATAIQYKVNATNATILNVDTSCSSFLSALNIADSYINSNKCSTIVILTITNFISRLPEFQLSKRSFVLGDGATATLVQQSPKNSIIASYEKAHGINYGLMRFEPDCNINNKVNYWERNCGPITVNFSKKDIEKICENSLFLVPNAVEKCLKLSKLTKDDISLLVTHQPNRYLIDSWRARIGIPNNKTHDTLKVYGNLFQGSIPITIADALEKNKLLRGDKLMMATFSNGGDFVISTLVEW